MEELLQTDGWIVMQFEDNTRVTIHTTLCKGILAQHGVVLRENYFYDLDHGTFVKFREDAVDVSVLLEKPCYDSEVLNFANRFI